MSDTQNSQSQSKVMPDEETKERIKNLGDVGIALNNLTSENSYQTDFYVAKEALNKFKAGVEKLELDPESLKGMLALIDYLNKKIDRRLNASLQSS